MAPGVGTVLHRHAIEEIYIVAKGGGMLYLAPGPESENKFPGEPEAFPFSANSSFSIPVNAVHQVGGIKKSCGSMDCEIVNMIRFKRRSPNAICLVARI